MAHTPRLGVSIHTVRLCNMLFKSHIHFFKEQDQGCQSRISGVLASFCGVNKQNRSPLNTCLAGARYLHPGQGTVAGCSHKKTDGGGPGGLHHADEQGALGGFWNIV